MPGQAGAGTATVETVEVVAAVGVEEAPRGSSGGGAASATGASCDALPACARVQDKTVCGREGAVEEALVEEDVREGNDEVCVCACVCVNICICICTCKCMCVYTHAYIYLFIYMFIYAFMYVCMYIDIYIHTHIHTYTRTYRTCARAATRCWRAWRSGPRACSRTPLGGWEGVLTHRRRHTFYIRERILYSIQENTFYIRTHTDTYGHIRTHTRGSSLVLW